MNENLKEYSDINSLYLFGSQNYCLDNENSDIDLVGIVIPTLDDLILKNKPTSHIIEKENGHIDVKDIRIFLNCLVKSNPAYIELIYSDYKLFKNDTFKQYDQEIQNILEENQKDLLVKFMKSSYGIMLSKKSNMYKKTPTYKDNIEKYGYEGKNFSHLIRMESLINQIYERESLSYINWVPIENREEILMAKRSEYSLDEVEIISNRILERSKYKVDKFCETHQENASKIQEEMNQLSLKIIKNSIL